MNKTAPIIPLTRDVEHAPAWRRALSEAVTRPSELLSLLGLPDEPESESAAQLFRMRVPRGFITRMRPGDRYDPLLLQVLPVAAECQASAGFMTDPLGEAAAMAAPGLLHKYQGRVLLTLTGACGIHCRYCFRRHYPYAEANPSGGHWEQALAYIRQDSSIHEVILSGGDPLSLSDQRLTAMVTDLATIPHLQRLRIHSRLPVVLPERVTPELLGWLTGNRLRPVLVIHANHAQEIDATVQAALRTIVAAGIPLLNQSVLLKHINDTADGLCTLSETLFDAGALPYYLHQLDHVQGAAHFEVTDDEAQELMTAMRARLPGYLVPRLVREQAGEPGKSPL
ncbi:MAG: EF-P beta-lysylation protein EpmB [Gammaproteobacteria bacterium]|nr:EF-P beta-lysylation protein EpmB [Gammaproteobacteria bacterium]MBU2478694.1 EF-P beta-lysylation protein EpmB [Gammaproteobacteria bacterium]